MTSSAIRSASLAAACALALAGCADIVTQYYRPEPTSAELAPFSGSSRVLGSEDPAADAGRLLRDGYVRIGEARFKTDMHVTFEEIQARARVVRADVVLFSTYRPGSDRALPPQARNSDGSPHLFQPYTHISGAETAFGGSYGEHSEGGGMMDFNGKVTSSGIPGISAADAAVLDAPQFVYAISFWRKAAAAPAR